MSVNALARQDESFTASGHAHGVSRFLGSGQRRQSATYRVARVDELTPARGMVLGVLLGSLAWAAIIGLIVASQGLL
jgi:hypothetical protein